MIIKTIIGAFALSISTAAFAAETAPPAPEKECCCCEKNADGKMACCDKHKKAGVSHEGHESKDMDGMSHQ
jgi:hypothetical protein